MTESDHTGVIYDPGDEEETRAHGNPQECPSPQSEPTFQYLLLSLSGTEYGRVASLTGQRVLIGRGAECHIVLSESEASRQHARLVQSGPYYVLEDLASSNGTFVNGKRIVRQTLVNGDVLRFGPKSLFRFTVTDSLEETLLRHLYEASVLDPLTGAARRAYVDLRLAEEISYARRHGSSLSVLMLDIDNFKRVNDRYGHPVGDQVLAVVAAEVSSQLREEDVFGRFGGEEFLVILRKTNLGQARLVAERMRRVVEAASIEHDGDTVRVTVSIGCASEACCEPLVARQLVEIADKRLYSAKRLGRNRVDWGEVHPS